LEPVRVAVGGWARPFADIDHVGGAGQLLLRAQDGRKLVAGT